MSKFEIDFLESYDDESIIEELKRISSVTGKSTVTKKDIENHGRISYSLINKRFGSLRKALQKANLEPTRFMNASDVELLEMLIELWEKTLSEEGRKPMRKDLDVYDFPVSGSTYYRRFGSWKKALIQAYNFVEEKDLDQEEDNDDQVKKAEYPISREREKKRKRLSLRKRFFVLKRDSFSCSLCGASGPGVKLEVDHIVPVSKGGTNSLDNLQTLCFECNRGKRDSLQK